MNYISHFYFFEKSGNPWYNTGLVLPDLVAAYNRNRFERHLKEPETPHLVQLYAGIQSHYLGDRMFHGSGFFTESVHYVKEILIDAGLDKERLRISFLAHIVFEMTIDRIILKSDHEIGTRFYENLEEVNPSILLNYVDTHAHTGAGWLELFSNFKKHRFLFGYIINESFLYSLNRIISRVGLNITKDEEQFFIFALDKIEQYCFSRFAELNKLFADVKTI